MENNEAQARNNNPLHELFFQQRSSKTFIEKCELKSQQFYKKLDSTPCDCGYCYECSKTSRIMEKY